MFSFFSSPIRARVAKAIEQKLLSADKAYDEGCKKIDEEAEIKRGDNLLRYKLDMIESGYIPLVDNSLAPGFHLFLSW